MPLVLLSKGNVYRFDASFDFRYTFVPFYCCLHFFGSNHTQNGTQNTMRMGITRNVGIISYFVCHLILHEILS